MQTKKTNLTDGSLANLAKGVKIDKNDSVLEMTDNAFDYQAKRIDINVDDISISVLSYEINNTCDDAEKVFSIGCGHKLKTKANGLGKNNQGLKYGAATLIGEGKKGTVIVASKPVNGKDWYAVQTVDYTNQDNWRDLEYTLYENSDEIPNECKIPDGYNFMVKCICDNPFTDKELTYLKMSVGLRYCDIIKNDICKIYLNGYEIEPQDRLYSCFGSRVDYHPKKYFSIYGDDKAVSFEYSDLRYPTCNESYKEISDDELIAYDTPLSKSGRKRGIRCINRSGISVAHKNINVIIKDLNKVFSNALDKEQQHSLDGFRATLHIDNDELFDKLVNGANKCDCALSSDFAIMEELKEVREYINNVVNDIMRRYHIAESSKHSLESLDKWCNDNSISTKIYFSKLGKETEAITMFEDSIIINTNSPQYDCFGHPENKAMFLYLTALLRDVDSDWSTEEIYDFLDSSNGEYKSKLRKYIK